MQVAQRRHDMLVRFGTRGTSLASASGSSIGGTNSSAASTTTTARRRRPPRGERRGRYCRPRRQGERGEGEDEGRRERAVTARQQQLAKTATSRPRRLIDVNRSRLTGPSGSACRPERRQSDGARVRAKGWVWVGGRGEGGWTAIVFKLSVIRKLTPSAASPPARPPPPSSHAAPRSRR